MHACQWILIGIGLYCIYSLIIYLWFTYIVIPFMHLTDYIGNGIGEWITDIEASMSMCFLPVVFPFLFMVWLSEIIFFLPILIWEFKDALDNPLTTLYKIKRRNQ